MVTRREFRHGQRARVVTVPAVHTAAAHETVSGRPKTRREARENQPTLSLCLSLPLMRKRKRGGVCVAAMPLAWRACAAPEPPSTVEFSSSPRPPPSSLSLALSYPAWADLTSCGLSASSRAAASCPGATVLRRRSVGSAQTDVVRPPAADIGTNRQDGWISCQCS